MKHDFSALSAGQRRAAEILATDSDRSWSLAEIAAEVNVNVATLYRWRQDPVFIAYKNDVAERSMTDFLSDAYKKLRHIAINGSEKNALKAVELAMKNQGRLTDVQRAEVVLEDKRTNEDLAKDIELLQQQLNSI